MAKSRRSKKSSTTLAGLWGFVAWLTGVLVSLAVGFGMVNGVLSVPYVGELVTATAGWIVVILTALGVILVIVDKLSK